MRRRVRRSWQALASIACGCCDAALAETLIVPQDHSTIQEAIDAAEEGDLVLVEPGTYTENIELRSGIDVAGRETARTLIAPDDASLPVVTIASAAGTRFSNVTIVDAGVGISVESSNGVEITNVVIDEATEAGIEIDGSAVTVANNVFYRNGVGVSRGDASTEISSNIFAENGTAIATLEPLADPFQNVRSNCYFGNEASPSGEGDGGGAPATFGDPLFVDPEVRDFHLREGSACIDVGRGLDVIDGTAADAGAYGGAFADPFPFPVGAPLLEAVDVDGGVGLAVTWEPNTSHRVTSSTNPGGYRVYYKRGTLPEDATPEDYDGTGAAGGPSPIDVGDVTSYTLEGLDTRVEPPLAPRLIDVQGRNESAIVVWEEVADADAYRVYYGVNDVTENRVDVEGATSLTVAPLANGTTYRFAASAISRATYHVAVSVVDNSSSRNESVLSPPSSIALGDDAESELSAELTATPNPIEAFPPLPDEDECFIATAAFGSKHAADVEVLRAFRDRFLLPHALGRGLVWAYYAASPRAARFIERHPSTKPAVRAMLKPFVLAARAALEGRYAALGMFATAPIVLVAAVAFMRRRTQRAVLRSSAAVVCIGLVAVPRESVSADAAPDSSPPTSSPRWMYEIKGGYAYPDVDDYEIFYGDDRDTVFAVAGAYRLRDWLEVGARIGYRRDDGIGRTVDGGEIEDAVRLEVLPVHAFADFIFARRSRRFTPYAGLGFGWALYEQEVEMQEDVDGRTDAGLYARAGMRFRFASSGRRGAPSGQMFTRSYAFFEAEHFDADVEGIELGATSYLVGVRFEFEF